MTLECKAVGLPPPNIHWLKEDLPVKGKRVTVENGTLIIRRVQRSDRAQYWWVTFIKIADYDYYGILVVNKAIGSDTRASFR